MHFRGVPLNSSVPVECRDPLRHSAPAARFCNASSKMHGRSFAALRMTGGVLLISLLLAALASAADEPPAKPVPRLQLIPQPYDQLSFQRDGQEIARYHFGKDLRRPFVFPLVGPSGRPLTRMGHPRDPVGHSHHNSVWITHHSVDGVSFWGDTAKARIVHQRIEKLEDEGDNVAAIIAASHWLNESTGKVVLREHRRTELRLLDGGETLLVIDLRLEAPADKPVTLGKTPFGLLGVRMAKTIGVHDGGGRIRNSEGGVNEKGVLWKSAKWVDYSGPITNDAVEGVTLMDHPSNPNHPSVFHVRDDGWMCASLTYDAERTIEPGKPLVLRYGLHAHRGAPTPDEINRRWGTFAELPPASWPEK